MELMVNMSSMVSKLFDYSLHKQARMVNILSLANKLENMQLRQVNLDNLVTLANNKSVDLLACIVEMHNAMDLSESSLESCKLININ